MSITYTDGGRISELVLAGRRGRIETLGTVEYTLASGDVFLDEPVNLIATVNDTALTNTDNHVVVPDWVTDVVVIHWMTAADATGSTFQSGANAWDYGITAPLSGVEIPLITQGTFAPQSYADRPITVWAIKNADGFDNQASNSSVFTRPCFLAVGPHASGKLIGDNTGTVWSETNINYTPNNTINFLSPSSGVGQNSVAPIPPVIGAWFFVTFASLGTGDNEAAFRARFPNFTVYFRFIGMHMES